MSFHQFGGDTPERRIERELDRLLESLARRRGWHVDEVRKLLAEDLPDIHDAMRRTYQLGLEHNEITGEWPELERKA